MTLFATRMAVVGTALGALASAALVPVAHAQPPPLVVVGFTSDPAPEGAPAASLPVDPSSVRAEMSRALRTFVVAPEAADAHGVAPQVVARVHFTATETRVTVERPGTPNTNEASQALTFRGRLTQGRLVALVLALMGPLVLPEPRTGVDVRVNPYHDSGPAVARADATELAAIPPRSPTAFYSPNPYRVGVATLPPFERPPMSNGQNPYR